MLNAFRHHGKVDVGGRAGGLCVIAVLNAFRYHGKVDECKATVEATSVYPCSTPSGITARWTTQTLRRESAAIV